MTEVTSILSRIEHGDPIAAERLLPLVYEQLRRLAAIKMRQEPPGQTLQATALVHDAYLRLVDVEKVQHWNSRGHFFSAAAEAMRRILVEHARHKRRLRRGGDRKRVELEAAEVAAEVPGDDIVALSEALELLAAENGAIAEIVKLRYFACLSIDETAAVLGISLRTANRHWAYAKAWLYKQLTQAE